MISLSDVNFKGIGMRFEWFWGAMPGPSTLQSSWFVFFWGLKKLLGGANHKKKSQKNFNQVPPLARILGGNTGRCNRNQFSSQCTRSWCCLAGWGSSMTEVQTKEDQQSRAKLGCQNGFFCKHTSIPKSLECINQWIKVRFNDSIDDKVHNSTFKLIVVANGSLDFASKHR
jgi:hypothetical protein